MHGVERIQVRIFKPATNRTNVTGNVGPTTEHESPDTECMYSSILSLTSAHDVGEWSTHRPGRFTPGKKDTRYRLYRKLGGP